MYANSPAIHLAAHQNQLAVAQEIKTKITNDRDRISSLPAQREAVIENTRLLLNHVSSSLQAVIEKRNTEIAGLTQEAENLLNLRTQQILNSVLQQNERIQTIKAIKNLADQLMQKQNQDTELLQFFAATAPLVSQLKEGSHGLPADLHQSYFNNLKNAIQDSGTTNQCLEILLSALAKQEREQGELQTEGNRQIAEIDLALQTLEIEKNGKQNEIQALEKQIQVTRTQLDTEMTAELDKLSREAANPSYSTNLKALRPHLLPLMDKQAIERVKERHVDIPDAQLVSRVEHGFFRNAEGHLVQSPATRASTYTDAKTAEFAVADAFLKICDTKNFSYQPANQSSPSTNALQFQSTGLNSVNATLGFTPPTRMTVEHGIVVGRTAVKAGNQIQIRDCTRSIVDAVLINGKPTITHIFPS